MKVIVRKILVLLLGCKSTRDFILITLLNKYRDRQFVANVLTNLRSEVVQEVFQYPSIVNDGYLHISRAIKILQSHLITSGSFILDIGAAGGETCILFAEAFPAATIIGFEPISKTFDRLKSNTGKYSNIKIHHTALGSENASTSINIMNRITASSLYTSRENSSLSGQKFFEIVEKEEIEIKRLDDFGYANNRIALIKIDVQGYELEALKGGERTLERTHFILLELQNHDIYVGAPKYYDLDVFLRNKGFELFDLIPSIREKEQMKEFDALYINKSLGS